MSYGEITRKALERQERAETLWAKLNALGWDVQLDAILRNFAAFDRWGRGLISTGYLCKMTGLKRKPITSQRFDALESLARQLEQAQCECVDAKRVVEIIGPLAQHIRSIVCDDCGRMLYIKDILPSDTPHEGGNNAPVHG